MLDEHTLRHRELLWEAAAFERDLPNEYRGQMHGSLMLRTIHRRPDRVRLSFRGLRARLLSH